MGTISIALSAWLLLVGRGPSSEPPLGLPFSFSPGTELHPALSPDGRQVAFAWNGDDRGNFDIYAKPAGGGPAVQLTRDLADEYSPAWSPDGAFIAFLRRLDAERVTVLVAPAVGGTERAVTELSSGARLDWSRPGPFLTWSRDGKWLVAGGRTAANATDRLVRISVATGETLPLTAPPSGIYGDFSPAISRDGAILAFIRRISWGVSELSLLPIEHDLRPAGGVRRLDTGSSWNASPVWSPDGRWLILSTGSMDAPHLVKIAASGSGSAMRLSGFGDYGWQPTIAHNREGLERLVYAHHFESVNIWRQPLDQPAPAAELITSTHRSYEPDYSPDGSRIAFLSDRSGYTEIWVTDSNGAHPRQWTFLKQPSLGSPRWSPDGRRIAFTMPGPQGSSIFWIESPGETPTAVPDSCPSGYLAWAHDGRSIYFSTTRAGETNIWRVPLAGPLAIQVTTHNSSRVPAVSSDGHFLFFLKLVSTGGANDLFRIPLPDGPEERMLGLVDAYAICRDGVAYKYYRPGAEPEGPRLHFYHYATAKTAILAGTGKPLRYGVAVSPDCRYLLYSQADYDVSDLMLVDNFK